MSRKQKKSPQQTFKVSKEDLGEYYSKYLPQFAPGGAYTPTPYKSSAMYSTIGGRAASFMNRVVGAGKDAVRTKPPRPTINKRDYQKTTITNNTNEDQYYDSVDGSVETKNVAMGNGLNGWQGMDNYLTGLQEVTDAEGNPTFSQSTWNRDTGGIDYTNPDPSARTVNDIANERLSGIGAQYMTFNNDGNVDTYNTGTNNVAYDADTWSPPSVDNGTGDGSSSDEVIDPRQELSRTSTSTPTQQEQAQIDWCAANPDDCPDADLRYGGALPRFQGNDGSNETKMSTTEAWRTPGAQNPTDPELTHSITPGSTRWTTADGKTPFEKLLATPKFTGGNWAPSDTLIQNDPRGFDLNKGNEFWGSALSRDINEGDRIRAFENTYGTLGTLLGDNPDPLDQAYYNAIEGNQYGNVDPVLAEDEAKYRYISKAKKYGGGLPRFQGDEGSSELEYTNPFAPGAPYRGRTSSTMDLNSAMTESELLGTTMAPAAEEQSYTELRSPYEMFITSALGQTRTQNKDGSFPPPLETPEINTPETSTPVSTTGNTGSGMFQVNQDLGLPAPPVAPDAAPDMLEMRPLSQIEREPIDKSLVAPGPGIPVPEGTIEQEASWGDTFGARVNNKARYLGDKVLDSKIVRGASEMADMAVEGAGIFNDWYGDRQAESKKIQGISGTTTNAMAAVKSADSDGLSGNYGQNLGLLRPNDGIVSHSAKHGLEMYQDKGEVPEQQGQDTELLRQFLQMASPTFQFSESAIEDQKKSLGYMKNGGQVLDLDEGLIRELIAAGANIEIL